MYLSYLFIKVELVNAIKANIQNSNSGFCFGWTLTK